MAFLPRATATSLSYSTLLLLWMIKERLVLSVRKVSCFEDSQKRPKKKTVRIVKPMWSISSVVVSCRELTSKSI